MTMYYKEAFVDFRDSELGGLISKKKNSFLRSKACKIAAGVLILSSAFDSNKAINNIDDGKVIQVASSAIHLGTEIPLTIGLLNLRKKAFLVDGTASELIPEKEYVIGLEPQVLGKSSLPALV